MSAFAIFFAWHAIFTINMLGIVVIAGMAVSRMCFSDAPDTGRRFATLSMAVILIKVLYVLMYVQLHPDGVFSTDGQRYFREIQGVSAAPWHWDPIAGTGPRYSASAKLGMPYLYGLVLFAHRIDTLYGVLVLNIVVAYLTCLLVLLLTLRISAFHQDGLLAFFLAGVYPETLFWNARVVRENQALLLVSLLVYAAIRLKETYRLRYLAVAVLTTFLLALTRAQLSLLFLLIALYFGAAALMQTDRKKTLMIAAVLIMAGFLLRDFMEAQIKAAIGTDLLRYITLSPVFWLKKVADFLKSAPHLLSVYARQEHGALGILLAPIFVAGMSAFVLTVARFGRIFHKNRFGAGLMVFLVVAFLFVVATIGLINIRFRATVAPLVLALISVTIGHYWRQFGFSRFASAGETERGGKAGCIPQAINPAGVPNRLGGGVAS